MSSSLPTINAVTKPFAELGFRNAIPTSREAGVVDGKATLADGFPQETALPITGDTAGLQGIPPNRGDFNALGYLATQPIHSMQAGCVITFNSVFANAIGGYARDAILDCVADGLCFKVRSTKNNNLDDFTANPAYIGTSWVKCSPPFVARSVGDIFWSLDRAPIGAMLLDGRELEDCANAYPLLWTWVTRKDEEDHYFVPTCTASEWAQKLAQNGQVDCFVIDEEEQTLKLPLRHDFAGDSVIEEGGDSSQWYRLWKSGWLEQGGIAITNNDRPPTKRIDLTKAYSDTNYVVAIGVSALDASTKTNYRTSNASVVTSTAVAQTHVIELTTSSFKVFGADIAGDRQLSKLEFTWYACGRYSGTNATTNERIYIQYAPVDVDAINLLVAGQGIDIINGRTVTSTITGATWGNITGTLSDQTDIVNFVNSSVQTATANFRGNWETWADVPTDASEYPEDASGEKTPGTNDYMVVADASDFGDGSRTGTWRFKFIGNWETVGKSGWNPEYQVNEEPLTQAQINALNSGITSAKVTTYDGYGTTLGTHGASIAENASQITALGTRLGTAETAITRKQDKLSANNLKEGEGITLTFNTAGTATITNTKETSWAEITGEVTGSTALTNASAKKSIYTDYNIKLSNTASSYGANGLNAMTLGTRIAGSQAGDMSMAVGMNNSVPGYNSVAIGSGNTVSAQNCFACGGSIVVESQATNSVVYGGSNTCSNSYSFMFGYQLKSSATQFQTIVGRSNQSDADAYFLVGNGTSSSARSNAFVVRKNGSIAVLGGGTFGGDVYANGQKLGSGSYSQGEGITINAGTISLKLNGYGGYDFTDHAVYCDDFIGSFTGNVMGNSEIYGDVYIPDYDGEETAHTLLGLCNAVKSLLQRIAELEAR